MGSPLTLLTANLFGLFFYSIRRRHTRSLRDWSSDVCSSDLNSIKPNCYRSSNEMIIICQRSQNQKTNLGRSCQVEKFRSRLRPSMAFKHSKYILHILYILEIGRASCRELI